jgi:hypothetical protein
LSKLSYWAFIFDFDNFYLSLPHSGYQQKKTGRVLWPGAKVERAITEMVPSN